MTTLGYLNRSITKHMDDLNVVAMDLNVQAVCTNSSGVPLKNNVNKLDTFSVP